jgi:hypothetical protein
MICISAYRTGACIRGSLSLLPFLSRSVSSTDSEIFTAAMRLWLGFPLNLSRLNIQYQNQGGKKSTLHSV